jgi:hypothetical protein
MSWVRGTLFAKLIPGDSGTRRPAPQPSERGTQPTPDARHLHNLGCPRSGPVVGVSSSHRGASHRLLRTVREPPQKSRTCSPGQPALPLQGRLQTDASL